MDFANLVHPLNIPVLRAAALLLSCAGTVYGQTFVPVDIESELNELDIKVSSNNIGAQLILSLRNEETFPVACHAVFNNGPQTPVERRLVIKGEAHSQMSVPLFRAATRVRVNLVCDREHAAETEAEAPEKD